MKKNESTDHWLIMRNNSSHCCYTEEWRISFDISQQRHVSLFTRLHNYMWLTRFIGQYYNVIISKLDDCDDQQVITSSISIMFHDEAHRKEANNYWKFWISQQKHVDTARAIDIGT